MIEVIDSNAETQQQIIDDALELKRVVGCDPGFALGPLNRPHIATDAIEVIMAGARARMIRAALIATAKGPLLRSESERWR